MARGIVTARGGSTSHAAVICRAYGKIGIVGVEAIESIDQRAILRAKGELKRGEWITLDGESGRVIRGKMEIEKGEGSQDIDRLMELIRQENRETDYKGEKRMRVKANCDKRDEIVREIEGIGLCRTEHMFIGQYRLNLLR